VPAPVALFATLVGFGLVTLAGAWLCEGSALDFSGLFPAQGRSDWPTGVQEGDAPRFAVEHVDALRPIHPADGASIRELNGLDPAGVWIEPVVLDVHRLAPKR
jgi:hypothetical protein